MEKEQALEQLRAVVNKPAKQLTEEDRATVEAIAGELGVAFTGRKGCKSCIHDWAIMCAKELEKAPQEQEQEEKPKRKYKLKAGIDVFFGNIRVNELTLTDELAERLLARGFERKYIEVCE